MAIYTNNKKIGESSLECLLRTRAENDVPLNEKMTFVGRLDEAATGKMVFVSGDDIKDKSKYQSLDKEYIVKFIFGIKTDTGDLLGALQDFSTQEINLPEEFLQRSISRLIGKRQQKFHQFSSKKESGSPLWLHSKTGNMVDSPSHEIEIKSIQIISSQDVSFLNISSQVQNICQRISKEKDFRQSLILESWENVPDHIFSKEYMVTEFKIIASSGSYMRVLGEEIGEILNLPVCAYSIHRSKIIGLDL